MEQRAQVISLEAISSFRSSLVVYVEKARRVLDDAASEISSTRDWLSSDRLPYWEAQVRHRKRRLDEAKQALFRTRTAAIRTLTPGGQAEVQTAKRALSEAEDKVLKLKQWINKFDAAVALPAKEIDHLRQLTMGRLASGAAYLGRMVDKLESYVEAGQRGRVSSAPATGAEPDGATGEEKQ